MGKDVKISLNKSISVKEFKEEAYDKSSARVRNIAKTNIKTKIEKQAKEAKEFVKKLKAEKQKREVQSRKRILDKFNRDLEIIQMSQELK